jgi:predicted lactoylglutathione lyase
MRMIFVNLPVKDLDASKRFFSALGFTFNPQFTDDTAACMVIEENIFAMLLTEPKFQGFINGEISDASKTKEVLICLSCDSRAAVDDLLGRALSSGGQAWKPNTDYGMMYGASFQDPDGHVWELMWMDPAAVQGAQAEVAEPA